MLSVAVLLTALVTRGARHSATKLFFGTSGVMVRLTSTIDIPRYRKMNAIKKFLLEEEGLTTVEYAIAGALIGLAVVTAFTDLGDAVGTTINDLESAVESR